MIIMQYQSNNLFSDHLIIYFNCLIKTIVSLSAGMYSTFMCVCVCVCVCI